MILGSHVDSKHASPSFLKPRSVSLGGTLQGKSVLAVDVVVFGPEDNNLTGSGRKCVVQ